MEAGGGLWRPGGAAAWWRWQPGGGWWSLVEAWLKAGGGLVGGWWRPGGAVAWWSDGPGAQVAGAVCSFSLASDASKVLLPSHGNINTALTLTV